MTKIESDVFGAMLFKYCKGCPTPTFCTTTGKCGEDKFSKMSITITLTDKQVDFLERVLRTWEHLSPCEVTRLDAEAILLKIKSQANLTEAQ